MKQLVLALLVVLSMASVGQAACQSKTIFSCMTSKGKQIEVCDSGSTIEYSFGKPHAKPEKYLKLPRNQVTTTQWAGIGRHISYSVEIPSGDTVYSVFSSFDKIENKDEAGVAVIIKGKYVTTVQCSGKEVVNNLEGVKLKPTE